MLAHARGGREVVAFAMHIQTEAEITLARPVADVFDFAVAAEELPRVLRKWGPIPGVIGVVVEGDGILRKGSRRRISMSDRSEMVEEITAFSRPGHYSYHWVTPPPMPFSLLVRTAVADWVFQSEREKTRIVWTYRLEITTPLVYPIAVIVRALFQRWMQQGLMAVRTALAS